MPELPPCDHDECGVTRCTKESTAADRLIETWLSYINSTPDLISLLYDIGMMPEQLKRESKDWRRMLIIAERWKHLTEPTPDCSDLENNNGEGEGLIPRCEHCGRRPWGGHHDSDCPLYTDSP